MAPEQICGDALYNKQVDCWALGVVLYNIVAGDQPFKGETYNDVNSSVLFSEPEFNSHTHPWDRCQP